MSCSFLDKFTYIFVFRTVVKNLDLSYVSVKYGFDPGYMCAGISQLGILHMHADFLCTDGVQR